MSRNVRRLALVTCCVLGVACQRSAAPDEPTVDAGVVAAAGAPADGGVPELTPGGHAPPTFDPGALPGRDGPFVEPPLEEKPDRIAHVVVGPALDLAAAGSWMARLADAPLPIGYPALDQATALLGPQAGGPFVLVAGKFAREGFAESLVLALRERGFADARIVWRRYLHDRFRPAPHEQSNGVQAGLVFSGLAGIPVPLLAEPTEGAVGSGVELPDGAPVEVLERRELGLASWLRLRSDAGEGWLPAGRVLADPNVFPAATGRRAVLGVSLGCPQQRCRWDYWLVGPHFSPRRLLKPAGERLPHAFSPDGRWLAYAAFGPRLEVLEAEGPGVISLGPGTSPSWSGDGTQLYFRLPGVREQRDSVVRSEWTGVTGTPGAAAPVAATVLDVKGEPSYPKAISAVPPPVDFLPEGQLFTLFYRLGKDTTGKRQLERWGVVFTPQGGVVEKKGVAISE